MTAENKIVWLLYLVSKTLQPLEIIQPKLTKVSRIEYWRTIALASYQAASINDVNIKFTSVPVLQQLILNISAKFGWIITNGCWVLEVGIFKWVHHFPKDIKNYLIVIEH
jgi:hypothetical protein